ncbi:DNA topoisomerase II, putative [Babesia bigemina]|uniref:DNA topoisomerase 2 n=1 Tax=Babesia bigemina TaxID=5866 RepID=A0A061D967_BABBI|nr:DNA topoisomerase II, putative [Babesia bigemina]CDR97088.1 DNA topoisomerase II, putative [Babesia bigemina]|eukprot:XP_012769274.1 DNA topoisomerase II, putative [Babesia bigemina]
MAPQQKTIEQRYQKKSQLEHILLRPDTYIGNTELQTQQMWVYNPETKRMVYEPVSFIPGLYKIFDEILVNAADVHARQQSDPSLHRMTFIKVNFNKETGAVTVANDGEPIPVQIHKEHNMYVPEMIFGELLTSDNYDDSEGRITGGRNGFGAKLTNIFSKTFEVTCGDSRRHKQFGMKWEENMKKIKSPAKVVPYHGKDFVKVTFVPDYERFGITAMDDGTLKVLLKRVYDVAGTTGLKVFWNDERLPISDFKHYVSLYFDEEAQLMKVYDKAYRWEVMVSATDGSGFQQVSFVNNITTLKGGTHVQHVLDPLVAAITNKVKSKNKDGVELKPYQIKNYIFLFVNCQIVNPTFDSQTKETLTTKPTRFGSRYTMNPKAVAQILKSTLLERIVSFAQHRLNIELKKKMKVTKAVNRLTGIPKLEDANRAGTRSARDCTLILTEGDSAKTSCLAGLSVVGRDNYGVFPLKGKLLNVRDASYKQLVQNAEIQNILKIMGLDISKKDQTTPEGLRYGSIMIMTDQDYDGSHIKGLLINLLHYFWPKMIQYRGFIREFVTPLIKATKGDAVVSFFTMQDYVHWVNSTNVSGWRIKYYKGLGTSTDKEFKEYFTNIRQHLIDFVYEDEADDDSIDMAFNKKRVDDRKAWMQSYEHGTTVDHTIKNLKYSDFINKELIQFSIYDTERSIPSVVDGWKPGQRKVLFGCLKRNLISECKVAQLTGYVAEHSAYHHGEASLQQTIINMAQDFVGSNNINVLEPCGQFGSRKEGGKDASAARYIFTKLMPITRLIFVEEDDNVLQYQNEEGQIIEPFYYIPTIPMVLVNGSEGIGTGFSSQIPNYNPYDIISNLRLYLSNRDMKPMVPWYRKFTGRIEPNDKGGFDCIGTYQWLGEEGLLEITELPIRRWTHDYKVFLESLEQGVGRRDPLILGFVDNSTHESVHFTVNVNADAMEEILNEGVEKVFKLRTSIATSNMTLFDGQKKLKRYSNELEIVRDFAAVRLETYEKRRLYMINNLQLTLKRISNQVRFIHMVINQELILFKKKKAVLIAELKELKFDPHSELVKSTAGSEVTPPVLPTEPATPAGQSRRTSTLDAQAADYNYLLNMPLWSLTLEQVQKLNEEHAQKEEQLRQLMVTTVTDMWLEDLDRLETAMRATYRQQETAAPTPSRAALLQLGKRKLKSTGNQKSGATPKVAESPAARTPASASNRANKRSKTKADSDDYSDYYDDVTLVSDTYTDDDVDMVEATPKPAKPAKTTRRQISIATAFSNANKAADNTPQTGQLACATPVATDRPAELPPNPMKAAMPEINAGTESFNPNHRQYAQHTDLDESDNASMTAESDDGFSLSQMEFSQDALAATDIERLMADARRKKQQREANRTKSLNAPQSAHTTPKGGAKTPASATNTPKRGARTPQRAGGTTPKGLKASSTSSPSPATAKSRSTPQRGGAKKLQYYESSEEEDYYGEDDEESGYEQEDEDEEYEETTTRSQSRSARRGGTAASQDTAGSRSRRNTAAAKADEAKSKPTTPAKTTPSAANHGEKASPSGAPGSGDKAGREVDIDFSLSQEPAENEGPRGDSSPSDKHTSALHRAGLAKFSVSLADRLRNLTPKPPHN